MNCIGISPQLTAKAKKSAKKFQEVLKDHSRLISDYYRQVEHKIDIMNDVLETLLRFAEDYRNIHTIETVLTAILLTMYNKSCFKMCLQSGLFNKLIHLNRVFNSLEYEEVGTLKKQTAQMSQKTTKNLNQLVIRTINHCYDLASNQQLLEFSAKINVQEFK